MVLLGLLSRGRGAGFVIGRLLRLLLRQSWIKMLMCKVLMHKVPGHFSSPCGVAEGEEEQEEQQSEGNLLVIIGQANGFFVQGR